MSYKYTVGGTYKSRNRDELDKLRQKYIDTTQNYDPSKDTGYQEYAKMMREQGQLAMEDTVGKSTAATGGYGNSYAQTAGQQVYNDYARDISAAQDTYYDRALNRILGEMNMLQDRETADKAAWEEAYLNDITEAQKANDYSALAEIYGFEDEKAYKDSLRTELPEEELKKYINAASMGREKEYFNYLVDKGYNTDDLLLDAESYGYSEENTGGRTVVGRDKDGKAISGAIAITSDEINASIGGDWLDRTGENFHVSVEGDNYDVELGEIVENNDDNNDDNKNILAIANQMSGKSLFVYGNKLYYTNNGTVREVKKQKTSLRGDEYEKLIKAIRESQKTKAEG